MTMYPCPEHFIIRPGMDGREKTIVPLIAVDQLPEWIQLAGVPRQLDVAQASGLVNLGLVPGDGLSTYEVRLRVDRIRAILSGDARDHDELDPLAPSDSVIERTSRLGEKIVEDANTSKSQKQITKAGFKERQEKVLRDTQKGPVKLNEAVREVTETETTSAVPETRAWDDESEGGSSDTVTTGPDKQNMVSRQQHEGQADASIKKPPPEPTLSASRHNTAVDAATDKSARQDKLIRPHLMEKMMETRPSHVVGSRVKDKFLGTNPNTLYCRHWCHHGTCKWGWQCRYQHRMPTNQEGLREVGLKDFPTWYLLMMAGGGFPNMGGSQTPGLGLQGGLGMGLNGMRPMTHPMATALNNDNNNDNTTKSSLVLSRGPYPANALLYATERTQTNAGPSHASPMELRLIQGRMSALLAGSHAMSNRQKLRQIKEMREVFLRANALGHTNNPAANLLGLGLGSGSSSALHEQHQLHNHTGRANLHTNASVAANAAGLRAASQRQALREMERGVLVPRERDGEGKGAVTADELRGRLSSVSSGAGEDESFASHTAVREGKLVDIE